MIYCNGGTVFSFHQAIVIKFNIYVSIFTVCIVFGYSCNTVVIAFNVQLTVVCKEICCNFLAINGSCIGIASNTNANVFQLCYVNSVSIFITSCYVDDLTFLSIITNGNGTSINGTRIPLIIMTRQISSICTITNFCTVYEFTIKTSIFIRICCTAQQGSSTKCYTALYARNLSCSTNRCCIIGTGTTYSSTITNSLRADIFIATYISARTHCDTFTGLNIRTMTSYEAVGCICMGTRT